MMTLDGAALTVAWSAQAVALVRIGRRRDDELARGAAFVHLIAAAAWAVFDQVPPYGLAAGELAAAALGGGAVAVAIAACAHSLRPSDPARRGLSLVAPVFALYVASVLVASLGPDAQGQLLLSALWGLSGVVALVVGLRRRDWAVRMGAWALLGLAAGKVFVFDLASLTSVYRVGSFLALGILLLLAALAYQRMRPALTA
jgi:hypothetical protein